ncbi:MAG: flagellar basal body P-ring formation chaperone FlgA [Thermoguttaceae bacterium]|jgi:flagella basal body P-ring formation protein FlgA
MTGSSYLGNFKPLAGLLLVLLAARFGGAAELRLRPQCTPGGSVVRLRDVAEIFADAPQAAALGQIELFPAPTGSQQRFVPVRELQDLLLLRGVNLAEHRFSGSSQVAVSSAAHPAHVEEPQALSAATARHVKSRLCEAVAQYLKTRAGNRSWLVTAEIPDNQLRLAADPACTMTVSGGRSPWTGAQHFEVTLSAAQKPATFPLEAQVSLPSTVVTTTRALARGAVIRAGDVELQEDESGDDESGSFHVVAEVVGKEAIRAVAAGKALTQDAVRAPLLVHRGEVITVYAHSAGISIRTTARARDEGSQGDLVSVESLLDRSTFYGRVSGVREVEVYGRAGRTEEARAEPTRVVRR